MNYKELLIKYIEYIGCAEGVDFITNCDRRDYSDIKFTEEDWEELNKLAE